MAGGGGGGGGGGGTLAAAMARAAPETAAIPAGAVERAEAAAAEVVRRVRPTEASEQRRAGVVDYARRLVGSALGCEVFAYGSVPLKTYLPDGDVDLTVLGNTSYDSTLIDDIYYILESEEQNSDAEFEVKDLQLINAEVRIIKCTIENIVVDMSFNQTGGICALCFLELVDRKVGKDHLLKRSVILIKAWCYYESRLLGAHHGLISTYALETLILYIFNLFHKSLHSPLEVLYRFLEYFSKFDWDNYCISLNGPVALSSLPNQIVEATNAPGHDLLFDKEFLKNSACKTLLPPIDSKACYTIFRVKYLNIIDPLKEHNNLGRSVNKASFNRIRIAFSYGARKLGQVLLLPLELIPDEIYGFFKNTLNRNGNGVRPDIYNESYDGALHCKRVCPGKALLEDMSSMKISCTKPDQYPLLYQENGNGNSEQYTNPEMVEQVSCCTAEACHMNEEPFMHPQVNNTSHTFFSALYSKSGPSDKMNLSVTVAHEEERNIPPFPALSLVELSGDLDLQLRCLRQVQYHLEYMFDGFLQSVKEASSDCKVIRDSFDIPTLSTMSDIDVNVMLPGLLSPSSTETDERRLSPVSSHSTEYFSQQSQDEGNWGVSWQQNVLLSSGIIASSNGLFPCSYADSENSVPWYHSSDDIPSLHGTGPHILQKHIASLADNDKILINQQARVKNNQASAPKGNSATYEASARCKVQAVLDTGTKDLKISGYLKVQDNGHEHMSTNKKIDNYSCDTCKECVRPEDEAEIPKYYKHVRSSKNSLENQIYDIDTGFARSDIAMKQIPKYQPLKIQDMSNQCICPTRNLTGYQGFNVQKRQEIHNWPRKQTTVCEPLKRPNSLHGRACSNKKSIAKHIPSYQANSNKESEIVGKSRRLLPRAQISHCDNKRQTMFAASTCQPSLPDTKGYSPSGDLETPPLEETIEFGTLGPFSLTFMSPVSKKATNTLSTSKACANAAASVLQSRLTQSRSPGFYKIGDEDHFPPLHAGTR